MISHRNCPHASTVAARKQCRKDHEAGLTTSATIHNFRVTLQTGEMSTLEIPRIFTTDQTDAYQFARQQAKEAGYRVLGVALVEVWDEAREMYVSTAA